jgi:hypothetical protein
MSGESIEWGRPRAPEGVEGGGREDMGNYGDRPAGPKQGPLSG